MQNPSKSRTGAVLTLALVKAAPADMTRACALGLAAHVRIEAQPAIVAEPDAFRTQGGKWVVWASEESFKLVWAGTLAPGVDRKRKHVSSREIDGRHYVAIQLAKRRTRVVFNYDIVTGTASKDPQLIVDP